jgi:hypothetical protein
MAKRKRIQQRYKIDTSMQAWDLAKAGSALTIKVHGREGLLGTIERSGRAASAGKRPEVIHSRESAGVGWRRSSMRLVPD